MSIAIVKVGFLKGPSSTVAQEDLNPPISYERSLQSSVTYSSYFCFLACLSSPVPTLSLSSCPDSSVRHRSIIHQVPTREREWIMYRTHTSTVRGESSDGCLLLPRASPVLSHLRGEVHLSGPGRKAAQRIASQSNPVAKLSTLL